MSGFGVEPDDMTRSVMIDDKLNALLAGRKTAPGDELAADLSHMLGQLHQEFPPIVVSEQVEDAHVARMMEAVASLPVVAMVAVQTPLLERMRAGLSRRIAVATLALTTAFGGAAYAGVLPGPIQRGVAEIAAMVGLDLPDGDHGADMRLPATGGDEGGQGEHGTEREQERGFLGGTVEEGPRDGDAARGGADSDDRDQRDDSDPESNDGDDDNETDDNETDDNETDDNETDDNETDDNETDDNETDDNETDDNETDDLPEEAGEPDDGDGGEAEEPDSEDSADEVKDEDANEGSSDSGLGSEEPEADPIEVQD